MTNGNYVTDRYNVVHGTFVSNDPSLGLGDVKLWILENSKWLLESAWTVEKFVNQGLDVRSVQLLAYDVVLVPANDRVHFPHYEIRYQVVVQHDPLPLAAVLTIAQLAVAVLIVIAIAYTIVTLVQAPTSKLIPTAIIIVTGLGLGGYALSKWRG